MAGGTVVVGPVQSILIDDNGNQVDVVTVSGVNRLAVDATIVNNDEPISVILATSSGTPVTLISAGALPTSLTRYYDYTVPASKTLKVTSFYTGGAPSNASAGAVRAGLFTHIAGNNTFIPSGNFELAQDVTNFALVTGAYTAPSPDVSNVQFQTGSNSMRWIYTSSATMHARRYNFATAQDMSGYRYVRVKFYNDNQTGTTRSVSIILWSGTSSRTYTLSGTLTVAPFTSNTWMTIEGDIENPTSVTGTTFDVTAVTGITLQFIDGANKAGTVYWDSLRLEDQLTQKHAVYSADGTSVSVITAPEEYPAGTTLYMRTKNTNNNTTEFATVATGTLEST